MKISKFNSSSSKEVIELFINAFSASENEEEGHTVGSLVSNIIETTKPRDLIGFVASSSDIVIGGVFFTRLVVPNNQTAFMLSPMAIATNEQGKSIGQKLISHGLSHLKSMDTDLVFTYGDPNYYSKVGFKPISENTVSAPFKLSQPEGWLAQSLGGRTINPMQGATTCVEAFNDPAIW